MQHPEALRQEVISVVTAILRDLFIFCDDLIDDVIDPRFAWGELETLLEQALEQVRKLPSLRYGSVLTSRSAVSCRDTGRRTGDGAHGQEPGSAGEPHPEHRSGGGAPQADGGGSCRCDGAAS